MQYFVCFQTADAKDAGTDSNIWVTIDGAVGTSGPIKKPDLPGDEMEQGKTDQRLGTIRRGSG